MRSHLVVGLERLAAVTTALQRIRCDDLRAGIWEAADVQWWWRRPRRSDEVATPVWVDAAGEPTAAALLTEWPEAWTLDLLRPPGPGLDLDELAAPALTALERIGAAVVEATIRAGDVELAAWYEAHGFTAAETSSSGWLAASDRPPIVAPPAGYAIVDRVVRGAEVAPEHPLVARNGAGVEARLRQTSLYDPRLDLAVLAPDGAVAGYALFWSDPVTRIGLVEPVGVEDEHSGRGIAYAMISEGLDRLAGAGATTLRIGWESERAGELYTRLGFTDVAQDVTYRRGPAPPG